MANDEKLINIEKNIINFLNKRKESMIEQKKILWIMLDVHSSYLHKDHIFIEAVLPSEETS